MGSHRISSADFYHEAIEEHEEKVFFLPFMWLGI